MKGKEVATPWPDCRSLCRARVEGCTLPGNSPGTPLYTPTRTPTPRWPPNVPSNINCFRILVIKPHSHNLCLPVKSATPRHLIKGGEKKPRQTSVPPKPKIIIIKYSCSYSESPKHSKCPPRGGSADSSVLTPAAFPCPELGRQQKPPWKSSAGRQAAEFHRTRGATAR